MSDLPRAYIADLPEEERAAAEAGSLSNRIAGVRGRVSAW